MDRFKALQNYFEFPFPPHDFQEVALNQITSRDCSLLRFKVGLGKTYTSTLAALYYSLQVDGVQQVWVLCPPILLDQWHEFLSQIEGIPSVGLYRGSPKERKEMDLDDSIILVSYNIFRGKNDYSRFLKLSKTRHLCIIADELSLKNLKSQTYRKLKEILYRKMRIKAGDEPFHKLIALNATPISDLSQVYNWCSLFTPGVYISKRLFEAAHVKKMDHWGNVEEWDNVELMTENMELFTVDTDKEVKIPDLVKTTAPYHLSKSHMKLYNEVADAQLMNLPDEYTELAMKAMFSLLQRLVLIPSEFGLSVAPPVLEYIEGYLDQLDDTEGVLIYTRHVLVSKILAESVPDSVAIYGGVSKKAREEAFEKLKSGEVKRLVGNLDSLGVGLNLQMLNHVIFAEIPFRDDKLTQALGRVHRQGQKKTCFTAFPLAIDTLQYKIYHNLLANGQDLSRVIRTKKDIEQYLR